MAVDKISGYELAEYLYSKGGVAALVQYAGNAETDWLELKAGMCLLPEDRKKGETEKDLYWNIAKEVIALMNTSGGAIVIGIHDKTLNLVPLEENDPRHILAEKGIDGYVREFVRSNVWPSSLSWTYRGKTWELADKQVPTDLISYHHAPYSGPDGRTGEVVVLLVKPSEKIRLAREDRKSSVLLKRTRGEVGEAIPIYDYDEFDKYKASREVESAFYANVRDRFDRGHDPNGMSSRPHCGLSTVPLPDASFRGRDAELKRIREVCENGKIAHVWATGGTGKTQLLLRYAEKYADEYPGGSFFLQLDGVRSWDRLLQTLVAPKVTKARSWFELPEYVPAKNKDGRESPENMEIAPLVSQEIVDSIARKCKSLGPVLLVLDNIDEPKDLLSEDALKKIFPRGLPQGLDIVASARSKEGITPSRAPNVESVQLHDLPEDVAIALLCGGATDERDLPYIQEVLSLLGCRAFYLKKVAYLIEDAREEGYPLPVQKVLYDLKRDLIGALDMADDDPQAPGIMWHDWALPRILNKPGGGKIAKLVRAIAFYLPTGVPMRILEGLWYSDFGKITGRKILDAMEDDNFRHAIHVIYHYGLVLDDAVNGRAMMHRLDQLAIRKDSEQESGEWIDCIGKALAVNPCMAPADWVELLSADGTWFPFCPWGDLNGQEYAEILSANPDAASYIPDWSRISPHGWAMMLRETTRFDDHPECRFALLNPADVLEKRPELESRFDFSKLRGWQWSDLIRKVPKFAAECPFDRFSENDWSSFILHDPRLSEIDEIISRNRGVKALESLLQKELGLVEHRSDEQEQIEKHSENEADPIALQCGVSDSQVLSLNYLKRCEHLSAFVLREWPQLRLFVDMAELRDPGNGIYCLWLLCERPCFVGDVIWHEAFDFVGDYPDLPDLPWSLSFRHVSRDVDEKMIDLYCLDRWVMANMLDRYPEYAEVRGLKKRLPGQWIGVLMDQMRYEEFRMQFNWKGFSENDWYEMFMCSPRSFVSAEWKAVLADHGVSARVKRIGEELMTLNDGSPKVEYLLRELGTADAKIVLRLPCNQDEVFLILTVYLDSYPEQCPKLILSRKPARRDAFLPLSLSAVLPNPDSHTLSLRYEGNWWSPDVTVLQIYQDVSDWLATKPRYIGNGESVEIRHAGNAVAK